MSRRASPSLSGTVQASPFLSAASVVVWRGTSLFRVNVVGSNPKQQEIATPAIEAIVDTGSELTWLPGDVLRSVGIMPRKRLFATATRQKVQRDVGFAIVAAEGYETIDAVVFAEPSDMILLGVRTVEGFGRGRRQRRAPIRVYDDDCCARRSCSRLRWAQRD